MGQAVKANYPLDDRETSLQKETQNEKSFNVRSQKMPTIEVSNGSDRAIVKDQKGYNMGTRGKFDEGDLNESVTVNGLDVNLHDQFVKTDVTY